MRKLTSDKSQNLLKIVYETAEKIPNKDIKWYLMELSHIQAIEIVTAEKPFSARIIGRGNKYYIEIDKKFFKEKITTDVDLLFVILHELFHKTRGDFHRSLALLALKYVRLTKLAMDWLINAQLYRGYFINSPPLLLKKLYFNANNILCVLTPPCFIRKKVGMKDIVRYLKKNLKGVAEPLIKDLADLYYKIWCEGKEPSIETIVSRLSQIFTKEPDITQLLGDHTYVPYGPGIGLPWRKKDEDIEGGKFAGYSKEVREEVVSIKPPTDECMELYEAIKLALTPTPNHPILKEKLLPEQSVIPAYISRREAFYLASGIYPVFFKNVVPQEYLDEWSVRIYLDVSGSMEIALPFLFGLLIHLKDEISGPIYCFSNKVIELPIHEISHKKIDEIKYSTTYGTDFDCIAEHALENKFKRILIITDGYARFNVKSLKNRMKKEIITYVVFHRRASDLQGKEDIESEIKEVAEKWWLLTEKTLRLM